MSSFHLQDSDLPSLFHQTDSISIQAQRHYFRLLATELTFLALGALAGVFDLAIGPNHSSLEKSLAVPVPTTYAIAALLILCALVIRVYRIVARADDRWYEARAVAESVKSLAWRYAVGGLPFDISAGDAATEELLPERMSETLTDVPHLAHTLKFTAKDQANQITAPMRELRHQDLSARIDAYRTGRVDDQLRWYQRNAQRNHRLSRRLHWLLAIVEATAVIFILMQFLLAILVGVSLSVEGFVAALVTAGIAWSQAKRYTDLSVSYRVAAREALSLQHSIPTETSNSVWAAFVDDAESAFSREHRLWRATRSI